MGCVQSQPERASRAPEQPAKQQQPSSSTQPPPQPDGPVGDVKAPAAVLAPPLPGKGLLQPGDGLQAMAADSVPSASLMVVWRDPDHTEVPQVVPNPPDEQARWDQLSTYNILDTEPEEAYDRITELCKTLFQMPIAMVTFVDRERVWLKSVQGLPGLKEVERRHSLCAWTLLSRFPEALVVQDLREDVRFKDFPVVTDWPHVRFYAASPLVNKNNVRLGTLCILDFVPREFSVESTSLLAQLANMVMREVERKREMNMALCSAALRHHSGDSITHDRQGLMLLDMATSKWAIYLVNDAWQRVTGISQEMAAGSHFWDLFEPPPPPQVQAYRLAVEQRRNFELRIPCSTAATATGTGGTTNTYGGSTDALNCGSTASNASGPLPGLPAWGGNPGGSNFDASNSSFGSIVPPLAGGGSYSGGDSRRRSLGAAQPRYVRFQFRSVSSVASHMAPAVSIPPTLMSSDGHNYYWSTVDVPAPAIAGAEDGGAGYFGLHSTPWGGDSSTHGGGYGGPHGMVSGSGGGSHSSDPGSAAGHSVPRTTFSLLPEDNPFQDITIGSLLGWGSYGRVHRGYWNGSLVAVKVLEQVAGDFNPRTSLEPLLHHRLSHPNIVAMFDVCTQEVDVCEDGRPLQEVWMVLEFCNRGTLSDAIQRGWLLTLADGVPQPNQVHLLRALTTAREVAGALEYLHSQSVLHGDLNGNNILLAGVPVSAASSDQRGFTAKVADFGLSRILTPENEKIITRTHGTITHMAPEIITESLHSKAGDVYSFGVILFELLSGCKPYHGMHYAQIVSSITSGKLLQLLPQQAGHLQPELLALIAQCLSTNPAERPSFSQVHQRLQQMETAEQQQQLGQLGQQQQQHEDASQQQQQIQQQPGGTQPPSPVVVRGSAAASVAALLRTSSTAKAGAAASTAASGLAPAPQVDPARCGPCNTAIYAGAIAAGKAPPPQ